MMNGAVLTDGSNKRVIKVDLTELDALAGRMTDRAQQVRDKLDGIEQEINDLESGWSDDNRVRFLMYFYDLHVEYATQADYLNSYAQTLIDVKHLYEGFEEEVEAALSGLGV